MWDVEQFNRHVSQIFHRCKSEANKHNFKIKLSLTWKVKPNQPMFCLFGPNLVILAGTRDELSHRQAHDWRTDGHTQTMTIKRSKLASGKNEPRREILCCRHIPEYLFLKLMSATYPVHKWALRHPLKHPRGWLAYPLGPHPTVGCWQINYILANIDRKISILILNKYPFYETY